MKSNPVKQAFKPNLEVTTSLHECTIIPDCIKKVVGPSAALMWGEMYRYSQYRDKKCRAAVETLASDCGMSYRSALNQIAILIRAGYIEDLTPGLKNKPHEYVFTDKAGTIFATAKVSYTIPEDSDKYFGMSPEELYNG